MEKKLLSGLEKNIIWIYLGLIVVASIVIRYLAMPFISDDMSTYLLGWFMQMQQLGGLHGLNVQVGNYSVLYQTFIAVITYIPVDPLISIKVFSCFFDYVLAFAVFFIMYEKNDKKSLFPSVLAFAIILLSPVVFMNSSLWGQCDSIYTSLIMLSLYFFKKEKYVWVFLFFGLAFSFKMQAIFYLPFYLFAYLRTKKYSILHFLIVPATMIFVCIPAYIMGRGFKGFISPYYYQTDSLNKMSFSYPSFWSILSDLPKSEAAYCETFKNPAIILTFVILATLMIVLCIKKCELTKESFLYIAFILAFTCTEFLPSMHERYAFPIEILAIIIAFKQRKTIPLAIWLTVSSCITYGSYLFGNNMNLALLGIANLVTYIAYIYILCPLTKTTTSDNK